MRHSLQKHNVARLRVKLNEFEKLDQEQFAKLIGCSTQKLRNIETGRTPLDELLARRIADETGIAKAWLLENNPKAPLVSDEATVKPDYRRGRLTWAAIRRAQLMCGREPFTRKAYENARTRMQRRDFGFPTPRELFAQNYGPVYAMIFFAWLRALFLTKHADTVLWKTQKFLEELAAEYGHNRDILPMSRLEIAQREHQVGWVNTGIYYAEKFAREWGASIDRRRASGATPGQPGTKNKAGDQRRQRTPRHRSKAA